MNLTSDIKNYTQFNELKFEKGKLFLNPNTDGGVYNDSYLAAAETAYKNRLTDTPIFNDYVNALNTTAMADVFTRRFGQSASTYPELGFMFLKSYIKKLIPDDQPGIGSDILYKIFNRNQELVEVPYAVAMYLGGLYYFNDPKFAKERLLPHSDPKNSFNYINNVEVSGSDIYNLAELNRTPNRVVKTSDKISHEQYQMYLPSMRILNRSVYDTFTTNPETKFTIVTGTTQDQNTGKLVEKFAEVSISNKSIMPPVGYGIQNTFLNGYNRFMFGDYLNGSITKADNAGLPHVLSGAYGGIVKPIKTYKSEVLEFTALYRNLQVNGFSYKVPDMVGELNTATQAIKMAPGLSDNTVKQGVIRAFVVYSKLKALYLSNQLSKTDLANTIKQLCTVKNIKAKFIEDVKAYKMSDFYYLMTHVFFTSYSNKFTFENRLSVGLDAQRTYQSYQANGLTSHLNTVLNGAFNDALKSNTLSGFDEVVPLTTFLLEIWELERNNLLSKYKSLNSQTVFALYPSAGGFVNPHGAFQGMKHDPNFFTIASRNNITLGEGGLSVHYDKLGDEYNVEVPNMHSPGGAGVILSFHTINKEDKIGTNNLSRYFSGSIYDIELSGTKKDNFEKYFKTIGAVNEVSSKTPQYLVNTNFDRVTLFRNFGISNLSMLKNSNRFFWFEGTDYGQNLQLDNNFSTSRGVTSNYFSESYSGVDLFVNGSNSKYFTDNYFSINTVSTYDDLNKTGFYDQFKLGNLMDSLDFEKLEEFKDLFLEFCTSNLDNPKNPTGFNLKSLMLASSVVTFDDIDDYTDENGFTLKREQLNLLLVGNAMYHYEFAAVSGINKALNVALTSAQVKKVDLSTQELCSQNITIANFSTVGSINYGNAPAMSMHLFPVSPDVLFANVENYDGLVTGYTTGVNALSVDDTHRYLTRKILFGDQYIPPYTALTPAQIKEVIALNKIYITNRLYTKSRLTENVDLDSLYETLVARFFFNLNIAYSMDLYKQLIRFIRSYISNIFKQMGSGMINEAYLPGNEFRSVDQIRTELVKEKPIKPALNDAVDNTYVYNASATANTDNVMDGFTFVEQGKFSHVKYTSYFGDFVKTTVNTHLQGISGYMNQLSSKFNGAVDPTSSTSFYKKTEDDGYSELKKETYYNIKRIYEKISGLVAPDTTNSLIVTDPTQLSKLTNIDLSQMKLFYNYNYANQSCASGALGDASKFDLYQIFQVVDRGNNDIGSKSLANLGYLYNNLSAEFATESNLDPNKPQSISKLTNGSIQSLLSGLASNNGFLFQQIPRYLNLNSYLANAKDEEGVYEMVDQMFGVHTDTDLFGTNMSEANNNDTYYGGLSGFPGYIFQLGSVTSTVNSNSDAKTTKRDLSNSFCLDVGLDKNGEIGFLNEDNEAPDEIAKSNVTCFTVDFGKQNQQMFGSVNLDTNEFYNTEESIRAWVDLVGNTKNVAQTTNIFPILEKRSYTCTVSGLGNATIQPLTYFYLRNVPLFFGTYWITNVSHKISPNTMQTSFKGVRQPIVSKNDVRRQMLDLFKNVSKSIAQASSASKTIITTGVPTTIGPVHKLPNSTKPYGEYTQQRNDSSVFIYDGMELIGFYLYSITQDNSTSALNLGLLATLYNTAKALTKSHDHATIIKSMADVAIGNMKRKASEFNDPRYSDGNNGLSISKLYKVGGLGFSSGDALYATLNNISKSFTDYSDVFRLKAAEKIYGVSAVTSDSAQLSNTNTDVTVSLTTSIGTTTLDKTQLINANVFIETGVKKYKGDDKFTTLPGNNLYDIFAALTPTQPAPIQYTTPGQQTSQPIVNNKPPLTNTTVDQLVLTKTVNPTTKTTIFFNGAYLATNTSNSVAFFTSSFDGISLDNKDADYVLPAATNVNTANVIANGKVLTFNDTIKALIPDETLRNSPVGIMAMAITAHEGYIPEQRTVAYRNNNPGNIVYDDSLKLYDPGVTVSTDDGTGHNFAKFTTPQLGMVALINSKIRKWASGNMPNTPANSGRYANVIGEWKLKQPPTFLQFFYTYAPPTDKNNPLEYTNSIVTTINKLTNSNLTLDSLVKEVINV